MTGALVLLCSVVILGVAFVAVFDWLVRPHGQSFLETMDRVSARPFGRAAYESVVAKWERKREHDG